MAALHAEAVAPEIVMTARWTDKPPRWIRLQPPLVLSPVPDPVFRTQHPPPALAVEHGEVTHRDPKSARLQVADAPLLDQKLVADLCFGEWIDGH